MCYISHQMHIFSTKVYFVMQWFCCLFIVCCSSHGVPGLCIGSLFCSVDPSVLSSSAIILRELVGLFALCYFYCVDVSNLCLFFTVSLVGLWSVNVFFLGHTHLLLKLFYQSRLILTALFQHDLINVTYLTACYLYQVMMTLHFLNDVANDAKSTQTSKITP